MKTPVTLKTLHVITCREWRAWLAAHHDRETEIWLVFYKQHTGKPRVAYQDAVDEALCFGWIDSLVRRLDDERYAQKFTPRKAQSAWSETNRRRFAELVRDGRMTAAGQTKGPPAAAESSAPQPAMQAHARHGPDVAVPGYIESALRAQGEAWVNFSNLAPSYRRLYVGWIEAGKREQTRDRRLAEAVSLLARNEKFGMK
jgi:uncharacterized protein YdeI (YjbR/CyaY-like superfamily)